MTPGKAMFGAIGGIAMVASGNKIIQDNNVVDPASKIGDKLTEALAEKYHMNVVENEGIISNSR